MRITDTVFVYETASTLTITERGQPIVFTRGDQEPVDAFSRIASAGVGLYTDGDITIEVSDWLIVLTQHRWRAALTSDEAAKVAEILAKWAASAAE